MGDGDRVWVVSVSEDVMTASDPVQSPTCLHQFLDQLPALHHQPPCSGPIKSNPRVIFTQVQNLAVRRSVVLQSVMLPMPGRYVIGREGVIRYAEVNPDYTQRPEPEAMLDTIRGSH